ncbi:MAG: DUF423 domain-containing protein [Opitutales bacterium]
MALPLGPLLVAAGAFWALFAVALGAFGAHGLEGTLEQYNSVQTWQTAVDYQVTHALALLAVGVLAFGRSRPKGPWLALGILWELGIICFSGSLYWLALDGPRWLGPVTPIGGVCFMVGWGWLFVWALRQCFGRSQESEARS